MNLYLHISKDRPSIAPEPSSPLPGRIAPSLRRSAATPPARSDLVVSHHLAGLLLVGPARAVAAAHDPGVHRPFHHQPKLADPRGACPALRSFPSADSRCRWTLRRHLAVRAVHAGRLSPPARLSPRLAVPLRVAAPWGPVVPSSCRFRCQTLAPPPGTLTHPGSSPAALPPRRSVDLGSCLPTSTAASRSSSIVGSVARQPFPTAVPGAPWGLGSSSAPAATTRVVRLRSEESVRQR